MLHLLFLCKVSLLGLSIAQVLSTVQVYASNKDYYAFLTSVQEAGYLVVPNEYVFSTLRDFGPAFCGGLFFTFTAGAALTILSSGSAWAWDRLFSRNRIVLFLLSILLLICLVLANIQGFSPLITGYLLFIPSLVFGFTLRWLPEEPKNQSYINIIYPLIPFLMLPLILIVWRPSLLHSDRFLDKARPNENIAVRNCYLAGGANMLQFSSKPIEPLRNVRFENIGIVRACKTGTSTTANDVHIIDKVRYAEPIGDLNRP